MHDSLLGIVPTDLGILLLAYPALSLPCLTFFLFFIFSFSSGAEAELEFCAFRVH